MFPSLNMTLLFDWRHLVDVVEQLPREHPKACNRCLQQQHPTQQKPPAAPDLDSISEIPGERWPLEGFFQADADARANGLIYAKWGGFLKCSGPGHKHVITYKLSMPFTHSASYGFEE